jgi:hypothetical protein
MAADGSLKLFSDMKIAFWQNVTAINFPNIAKASYIRSREDFVFVAII